MNRSRFVLALCVATFFAVSTGVADEAVLADGVAAEGLTLMIGDKRQWDTLVGSEPIKSASGYLNVEPDPANGAVTAAWNGKGEAQLFLAHDGPRDYSELLDQDAALVILIQIIAPPKKKTVIKMGCQYPCAANAPIDHLLKALPTDQWLRVSFDLKCFAEGGLDITNVDVPLLLVTAGKMAVSISDVSIVPGVGPDATIRCR